MNKVYQQIAILDFGSQYAHLIARRFRQLGVLAKLYPTDYPVEKIENLIGIVLSGSPGSVHSNQYPFNGKVFELNLPVLGLCYGHQLMAHYLGGRVLQSNAREYGQAVLQVSQSPLFEGLQSDEVVWMSHGDSVAELPKGFKTIGSTLECPIAAMANERAKIYGLQFHPEVSHTANGLKVLENFAFKICGATADWKIKDWQKEITEQIKIQVGDKKVFLLVSGGVDSTVCFALLEKALGAERVYGLHVDTGLMRKDEAEQVKTSLEAAGFKNLHIQNAEEKFLAKLAGVVDPEFKRQIIGRLFLDAKDQVADSLRLNPADWFLAQGTIYPDTIETGGTANADKIKTHHNRVEKIQELIKEGRLIEPIKDLYKDEVRELGQFLGLLDGLVWRQPFPGPGLGIRCLCEDGSADIKPETMQKINQKLEQSFANIKITYNLPPAALISVLPIKSVGVQGDSRTYAHPAVIEPADSAGLPWEKVEKFSPQITNEVKEVNRVLIRIDDNKIKISAGRLIPATLTKARLDLLRKIDAMVNEEMVAAKLEREIWQFPVVLIPFGADNKESVVLRPVSSLEAMTARFFPLPEEVLKKMVLRIQSLNKISFIFMDVTNKPPATIEWE
ncbi:MAG: glutamine-hydrolyzing GMP synthase [Candidatus Komeilibacteria bacterium]|nr:glutamine-hydrolyzing GMP synthase [Candidatus Komeilibacteria bacterium]